MCSLPLRGGQKTSSAAAVPALAHIVSVKHSELDQEHEVCAQALERLRAKKDASSLRAVLEAYEMHFRHEEQLLDQHLYATVVAEGPDGQLQRSIFDPLG